MPWAMPITGACTVFSQATHCSASCLAQSTQMFPASSDKQHMHVFINEGLSWKSCCTRRPGTPCKSDNNGCAEHWMALCCCSVALQCCDVSLQTELSQVASHEAVRCQAASHEAVLSQVASHEAVLSQAASHQAVLSQAASHKAAASVLHTASFESTL